MNGNIKKIFSGKKFIVIGKFSNVKRLRGMSYVKKGAGQPRKNKRNIIETIQKFGGECVHTLSEKVSYVILPSTLGAREMENTQINRFVKKERNNSVQFLKVDWIEECERKKDIIESNQYEVEFFMKKRRKPVNSMENIHKSNRVVDPYFDLIVESKYLKEIIDEEGNYYLYNTLTGKTTYNHPKNYDQKLFGTTIFNDNYYDKEYTMARKQEIEKTVTGYRESIKFVEGFKTKVMNSVQSEILKQNENTLNIISNTILNFLE